MKKQIFLSVLMAFTGSFAIAQVQLPGSAATNLFPPVGKVGIGTINPSESLDIKQGTVKVQQFADTSNRIAYFDKTGTLRAGTPLDKYIDPKYTDPIFAAPLPGANNLRDAAPFWSLLGNSKGVPTVNTNNSSLVKSYAQFGVDEIIPIRFYTGGGTAFNITNDAKVNIEHELKTPLLIGQEGSFSGQVTIQKLAIGGTQFGPTSALTVNGKIAAKEVNLVNGNFPDYVFEKDYNLMSLKELNAYILKNKRLPGMPSAENVAKDGMNVNEINTKLVEKVEELTLYIIQLQQQIDEQGKKIESLSTK